jgi:hypothetical protein
MLVFALLEWKWRLEVKAQQWFWPWGQMESFRAGNYYLSVESDLQADAGVCFVGVEVEAQQWFWPSGRMESFRAGNYYRSKAICRLMLEVFLPSQFAKEVFREPPLFQYAKEVFWEAKRCFCCLLFLPVLNLKF